MACKSCLNLYCKSGIAHLLALVLSGSFSAWERCIWGKTMPPSGKQSVESRTETVLLLLCSLHLNHTSFTGMRPKQWRNIYTHKYDENFARPILLHELLHARKPDSNVGKVISPVTTHFITMGLFNGWRFRRSLHSRHRWSNVKKQATTGNESRHVERERMREKARERESNSERFFPSVMRLKGALSATGSSRASLGGTATWERTGTDQLLLP